MNRRTFLRHIVTATTALAAPAVVLARPGARLWQVSAAAPVRSRIVTAGEIVLRIDGKRYRPSTAPPVPPPPPPVDIVWDFGMADLACGIVAIADERGRLVAAREIADHHEAAALLGPDHPLAQPHRWSSSPRPNPFGDVAFNPGDIRLTLGASIHEGS